MANSPKLAIPLLATRQANNVPTANAWVGALEQLGGCNILDHTLTTPPGSPTAGDAYIVAATATDAWLGEEGNIAIWDGSAWSFFPPLKGQLIYRDSGTAGPYIYNGSTWVAPGGGGGDALTSNPLSQFAATTSAQLRGVLSDEIGTGFGLFVPAITSQALKVLRVNAGATDVEWATAAGGGDALTTDPLSQFAATTSAQLRGVLSDEIGSGFGLFAPTIASQALKVLRVNAGATDVEWFTPAAGDALTANPLSQFAATTSAQLRGVLSDEIGSGFGLFAPTIVAQSLKFLRVNAGETDVEWSALGSMAIQNAGAVAITGGTIVGTTIDGVSIKSYVDNLLAGLKWKQTVIAATTAAGTLASDFENGDTVDGVVLTTGDRILIKDQAAGAENGIYIVAASGAPTRASDADSGAELISSTVIVEQGTVNADKAFVCTNNSITLGTTAIVFVNYASALIGALLATNNLSDVANAGTARTNLGLGALATKSSVATGDIDANAVTYAKIQDVSATDKILGRSTAGAGIVEEIACTAAGRALIDDADASAQRTTLGLGGLAVKTTVATGDIDADAVTYAKIQNVSATDKVLGRSTAGSGDVEEIACTSAGRALIDDADASAQRTTLGLAIGTNVQAYSAVLTALVSAFIAAGSGIPSSLDFFEDTASGTNKIRVTAPAGNIASDKTLTLPDATDTLVGKATTDTLTNKRITKRVQAVVSSATVTPNASNDDGVAVSAQAADITFANPSGTPTEFQTMIIRIKDNGTARLISFGTKYRAMGTALPTTTVISQLLYMVFEYHLADDKWDLLSAAQQS